MKLAYLIGLALSIVRSAENGLCEESTTATAITSRNGGAGSRDRLLLHIGFVAHGNRSSICVNPHSMTKVISNFNSSKYSTVQYMYV